MTSSGRRVVALVATFAVAVACGAGVIVACSGATDLSPSQFRLVVGLASCLIVASVTATLLAGTNLLPLARSSPIYAAPLVVMAVVTSVAGDGVGPLLPHQIVWALIGTAFVLITVSSQRTTNPWVVPTWLLVYAGLGFATVVGVEDVGGRAFLDVGLSVLALFVIWQVAVSLAEDGGLLRLIRLVVLLCWGLTAVALVVEYVGVPLGSMSPQTVTLPWQIPLSNVFVDGNIQGYGFVHGQAGREITFVVCLYHLVRLRYAETSDRRMLHGLLTGVSFILFLTCYGRIPFAGGMLGLAIVLSTSRLGTSPAKLLAIIAGAAAVVVYAGLLKHIFALREGATSVDTGHLAIWVQHLNLFSLDPVAGVGGSATYDQIVKGAANPVWPAPTDMPLTELVRRGSRGEGGWTGLLAQRGVVLGGIILGLIALAARGAWRRFPTDPAAQQDTILLRAILPASFVFYVTDIVPMGVYTFTTVVVAQVTMIGVVRELRHRTTAHMPHRAGLDRGLLDAGGPTATGART